MRGGHYTYMYTNIASLAISLPMHVWFSIENTLYIS